MKLVLIKDDLTEAEADYSNSASKHNEVTDIPDLQTTRKLKEIYI